MADPVRGPFLAGGRPGQTLKRDLSNRTLWVDDVQMLTGDLQMFVYGAAGRDDNDGLSDGAPFKTIQAAINATSKLNVAGYHVDINIFPGVYVENLILPDIAGQNTAATYAVDGNVRLIGANRSLVFIGKAGSGSIAIDVRGNGWAISGVTLQAAVNLLYVGGPHMITLPGTLALASAGANVSGLYVTNGGSIMAIGTDVLVQGAAWGSLMYNQGGTIFAALGLSIQGNPSFAQAVNVVTFRGNTIAENYDGGGGMVCTGLKWTVDNNGVLYTGGPATEPGSLPGTTASGGRYNGTPA